MNIFLYYLDKMTAWLDFSWFIKKEKKENERKADDWVYEGWPYAIDPLLDTEPLLYNNPLR
jgi:hypothetical protein